MKKTPLLMRGELVRETIADEKTQTRRIIGRLMGFGPITQFDVSDTPGYDFHFRDKRMRWNDLKRDEVMKACPYGGVGDQLFIRENFYIDKRNGKKPRDVQELVYAATPEIARDHTGKLIHCRYITTEPVTRADAQLNMDKSEFWKLKPGIHMPYWACRLHLENLEIRIERLNDISEADAFAEGIDTEGDDYLSAEHAQIAGVPIDCGSPARFAYKALWERINGRGSWELNPLVWVIKYQRINENNLENN